MSAAGLRSLYYAVGVPAGPLTENLTLKLRAYDYSQSVIMIMY